MDSLISQVGIATLTPGYRATLSFFRSVVCQHLVEFIGQPEVIDYKSFRFVEKNTIHPCYGLH